MADREHVAKLKKGVSAWNKWLANESAKIDLSKANLSTPTSTRRTSARRDLGEAVLRKANINNACPFGEHAWWAADLRG